MKYQIGDVKSAAIKVIDITEYFTDPGGPVILTIRHYSHYEANEINALLLQGQRFKRGRDDENEVSIDKFHMAEAFLARMQAGVVVEDKEFPFQSWNAEFIRELDNVNPGLTGFINDQIVEHNRPLLKKRGKSSSG